MATTKTVRKSKKFDAGFFAGTVLEQPFASANKAFLASIGFAEKVRTDVEAQFGTFEARYNALAKDGEKVRNRARKTADDARKDAVSSAQSARKNVEKRFKDVEKRFETTIDSFLAKTPVATSKDVAKLNRKLDKVLAEVAK